MAPSYLGGREDGISTNTVKCRHGAEQRSNGQVKHHRAQCGCEDRGKGGLRMDAKEMMGTDRDQTLALRGKEGPK